MTTEKNDFGLKTIKLTNTVEEIRVEIVSLIHVNRISILFLSRFATLRYHAKTFHHPCTEKQLYVLVA